VSAIKKAKGFRKSRPGTYLSIGTTLFGAVSVARQLKKGRSENDTLLVLDAVLSAAAIATGVALLVRELRRLGSGGDDRLAD
jgi:hypothetical protein